MNDAQLHLILNHYPILGTLFGVILVAYGFFSKNKSILHTGLVTLFLAALFAIPTYLTGEGAEEIVEELGVDHDVIHEHEEAAELAIWLMAGLGLLSAATFFLSLRASMNNSTIRILYIVTLVAGLAVFGYMTRVGGLGGQIRHTEVRE